VAVAQARIRVVGVGIVALFTRVGYAISAGWQHAVAATCVGHRVTVEVTCVALLDSGENKAIATERGHARCRTLVFIVGVGVVTLLITVYYAVAAMGKDTVGSARIGGIVRVVFAVVTLLTAVDNAITAAW